MARSHNRNFLNEGSVGDFTFYVRQGRVVCRQRHNVSGAPVRTKKNMSQRTKIANVNAAWRTFMGSLRGNFEFKGVNQNDYNVFMSLNLLDARVFLSKEDCKFHVQLADNFYISNGSLSPSIELSRRSDFVLTNIKVGDLVINSKTTIGDLSNKMVHCDKTRFYENDIIWFYKTENQLLGVDKNHPSYFVDSRKFVIDSDSTTLVSSVLGECTVINNYLAIKLAEDSNSLVAFVHKRPKELDAYGNPISFYCSSQRLFGENSLLANYANYKSRNRVLGSYGKLRHNDRETYIQNPYPLPEGQKDDECYPNGNVPIFDESNLPLPEFPPDNENVKT